MNDNRTKPRRPRITQFKSVAEFWAYHTNHPEAFSQMDATGVLEMATKVRERTSGPSPLGEDGRGYPPSGDFAEKNVPNGSKTASKNGKERDRTGETRRFQSEPTRTNPDKPEQNNVPNGSKTASKNGKERDRTGETRASQTEQTRTNPDKTEQSYKVGPGNPPKEHQFQPGNPGGPGGPLGPRSMRKYIRTILFDEETNGRFAAAVTRALFKQAFRGNTHAIRIICENGNNRPKRNRANPN